jgi:hypothetical protein
MHGLYKETLIDKYALYLFLLAFNAGYIKVNDFLL